MSIGHISVKTTNNSVMFCAYVEKESISITMDSSVYPDCGSCPSAGKEGYLVGFSVLSKDLLYCRHLTA